MNDNRKYIVWFAQREPNGVSTWKIALANANWTHAQLKANALKMCGYDRIDIQLISN